MLAALIAGCGGSPDGGATESTPSAVTYLTARTGPIVAVRVGETAILDGSKSTSPSTAVPLSFSWSFSSKPDASITTLQNATTATPSFVADARGAYMVQLVVSAGGFSSQRDIQLVVATIDPERLTGPFHHQGLSSNCVQCHDGEQDIDPTAPGLGRIPGKSPNHFATSNMCETCHTPMGFTMASPSLAATGPFITSVDHDEVLGNCSTCHNGDLAIGKSDSHVPTAVECDNCHNTTTFLELALDGSFDHTGISSGCTICHNGIVAIGKDAKTNPIHIATNSDCIFCHLPYFPPTTVDFTGAFPDHTDPVVLGNPCEFCHNGTDAIGKIDAPNPPGHLLTSTDCALCHNTSNFVEAFVDHTGPAVTGVGITCDSCHDGIVATGLSVNHIPISGDCVACHTPGGTFAGGVFDHVAAGIVANCASCHDSVVAIGKIAKINPSHIPTSLDCSDCHGNTNFTGFAPIVFDHTKTTEPCASCHASGFAKPKTVDHIPSTDNCVACHTSTTSFLGATFDHTGLTRGCEGCHNGQFSVTAGTVLGKSGNHLPTVQDCYVCHTVTDPGFTPSITPFLHTGISNNCASCHDGSVNNVAAGAIGMSIAHIPVTEDCGICHSFSGTPPGFTPAFVDHTGPDVMGTGITCVSCHNGTNAIGMTVPPHVDTTQDCNACHIAGGTFVPAVFDHTGKVDNCASCHNGTDATGMTVPPHISTPEDCSVCHNTTAFAGAKFDHDAAGVVDNCASCHDNNTAVGKGTNHVPTIADCSLCHQTTGFVPGSFDHAGIVDNCASCHDAGLATPKKVNHVATNQDCGVCHNTVGFVPATFDHTGIVDNCASCHGVTATGMDAKTNPPHIVTSLDCSFCHTTATFVGGTWDHQGITGGCLSCHDGVTATGNSPSPQGNHFTTMQDCNICHSTQGWAPIDFTHGSINYPGDHNSAVGCISCHKNNSETITYPSPPPLAPACAGCHKSDYEPGPHKWYENPDTKYTVSQLKNCAGACHVYTDSSLNTRSNTRNSEHRVNDRDF